LRKAVLIILSLFIMIPLTAWCQNDSGKLPKEAAGEIAPPSGKIAFIREGNLWVMDWDGKNQFKVVSAENALGKLSWSADNKTIAFCREGLVDIKGPDFLGGRHKVYDIFLGYPDSAKSTTNWWFRLTDDFGSRFPEFTSDGTRIVFTKDLNANTVNATMPNYQTCFMDPEGGSLEIIRKDYTTNTDFMASMPTLGPDGKYAFVLFRGVNTMGVVIAPLSLEVFTDQTLKEQAKVIPEATTPAWSPDGKWIAFIDKTMKNQGIFIVDPALKNKYEVFKPQIGQSLQTFPISWSPDSKWLVFALNDGSFWIIDITGNGLRQISGPGMNEAPAWSK